MPWPLALMLLAAAPSDGAADTITPNAFTGTDSERINQAVARGAELGQTVVIPRRNAAGGDVWLLDSAILLPSDASLLLDGCTLKLSDRCRDNFFRSANCGLGIGEVKPLRNIHLRGQAGATLLGADHPRATGDSAKTLGTQTYGTDAGVAGESQKGDWRNIGILMANVDGFTLEGLTLRDSHAWAISLEACSHGTIRDLAFASTQRRVIDGKTVPILNQDGLDLRQGCHDILIDHITGYTGDDLIALTAIGGDTGPAGTVPAMMVSSPPPTVGIHHVIIRNLIGHCAAGHGIVRLLNTGGRQIHDVLLDGLLDTSTEVRSQAAIRIGDANPAWGGVTPLGDTSRVTITNVTTRATAAVIIAGSLADSLLSNITLFDGTGDAVVVRSGPQYVRGVTQTNVCSVNAQR